MIEAKYSASAKEMNQAYDMHWQYSSNNFTRLPLLGVLLLIVYMLSMYFDFFGIEMLALFGGLYCFLFPMAAKTGLKKHIKTIANKTFNITLDETNINIATEGLEIKAQLSALHNIVVTSLGILIYLQADIFYWLPKGALSPENYTKAVEMITKNAQNTVKAKNSCGCCSCGN